MKQFVELQQRRLETDLINLKEKQEKAAAAATAAAEKKTTAAAAGATSTTRSYTKEISVYGNDRLLTRESIRVRFV